MSSKRKNMPFTCQADKEKGPDDDKNDKKDDTNKDDPMGELPIPMSELPSDCKHLFFMLEIRVGISGSMCVYTIMKQVSEL